MSFLCYNLFREVDMDKSKIKGILFDFDNTLMDRQLAAYNNYADIIEGLIEHKRGSFEFENIMQDLMVWDEWGTCPKDKVFERFCDKYKLDMNLPPILCEKFIDAFGSYAVLFESTTHVLTELRNKYKLGIVTNGQSSVQNKKMDTVNIREHVDFVLVGGDYIGKPHPIMYEEAIKRMNLKAEEVVFVGDIFQTDIIGAKRFGMTPIWIMSDTSRPCSVDIITIRKLEELLEML